MKSLVLSSLILIFSLHVYGAPKRKKIDTDKLQKKYWTSKDYKTGVVQSRAFSKTNKFRLGLEFMNLMNDKYSTIDGVSNYRIDSSYFINERLGFGLYYEDLNLKNNTAISEMLKFDDGNFTLDHVKASQFFGASLEFVPIYSKMSWMNEKIIYFDLSISPKVGFASYQQQVNQSSPEEEIALSGGLDLAANIFINKRFSFTAAYRIRAFQADVLDFNSGLVNEEGKIQLQNFVTLGLNTYF